MILVDLAAWDDLYTFDQERQCYITKVEGEEDRFAQFPEADKMKVWELLEVPVDQRDDPGLIQVRAQDQACYCYGLVSDTI